VGKDAAKCVQDRVLVHVRRGRWLLEGVADNGVSFGVGTSHAWGAGSPRVGALASRDFAGIALCHPWPSNTSGRACRSGSGTSQGSVVQ